MLAGIGARADLQTASQLKHDLDAQAAYLICRRHPWKRRVYVNGLDLRRVFVVSFDRIMAIKKRSKRDPMWRKGPVSTPTRGHRNEHTRSVIPLLCNS